MRPAMDIMCKLFEQETGIQVEMNYNDSGAIITAIETTGKGDACIVHDPFPADMEKKGWVDRAEEKAMLTQSFASHFPEIPFVMASGVAGYGPGEDIKIQKLGKHIYVVGDMTHAARPGSGLMAPRVGLAGYMQANLVLRLLLGVEDDRQQGSDNKK